VILRLLLAGAAGLLLAACSPAEHIPKTSLAMSPEDPGLKTVLGKPTAVAFADVQKYVTSKSCTQCHDSVKKTNGVDLSSYAAAMAGSNDRKFVIPKDALNSPMYNVLTAEGKRHMPPLDHPQLSPDQVSLVFMWIDNGAKEFPDSVVVNPGTLKEQLQPYFDHPENIDYGVVKQYVLGVACMKCHSLNGDSPDKDAIMNSADMTSYKSLFSVFTPVVVIGSPENSKIFQAAAITQSMPPTKDGYDPIDSLRVKMLRLWILNCAIEDKTKLPGEVLTPNPDNPEKVRTCPDPSTGTGTTSPAP